MDNIVCIYKITNTVTGDFYIGQTINFHNRIRCHKNNPPPKMREDIKKYGWDAFKAEMVEECAVENLTEKERDYIKSLKPAYNTHPFDYTITEETRRKISEANKGKFVSIKTREKISKAKKGKKFSLEHCKKIQKRMQAQAVDLFGKAIICIETQEVFKCMVDAAEKLGIKPQNLTAALHGRQKTAGGYTWKYADESLNAEENVQIQTENRKLILCVETGEIFHSITEAANAKGTTLKGISNVIRGRAITSGGFHWKYADDQLNGKVRDESDRCDKRKPVICVETGEVFQSISEAARHFGILGQGITDVLNGVKVTTGGYHWHYADGRPDKTRERKKQKIFTKPVICIETGQIFPSVKDAIVFANVSRSTFFTILKNPDKTAGGFHWKYFEDEK